MSKCLSKYNRIIYRRVYNFDIIYSQGIKTSNRMGPNTDISMKTAGEIRNMSTQIEYKLDTMLNKTYPHCTMSPLLKNKTLSKWVLKNIEKVKFLLGLQSLIRFKRFIKDRVFHGAIEHRTLSRAIKLRTSDIERPRLMEEESCSSSLSPSLFGS